MRKQEAGCWCILVAFLLSLSMTVINLTINEQVLGFIQNIHWVELHPWFVQFYVRSEFPVGLLAVALFITLIVAAGDEGIDRRDELIPGYDDDEFVA
jgi:hypothetical protein